MKHAASALLSALLLAASVACGGEPPRTRARFPVEAAATSATGLPAGGGFMVDLSRARLSLRAVRLFAAASTVTAARRPLPARVADALLGMPAAHAHPGHLAEGDALGELFTDVDVDLVAAAPLELGVADGLTGDVATAAVDVAGLSLAGTATDGERTLRFSVDVSGEVSVSGAAAAGTIEDGARARLTTSLPSLVERIDFASIADDDVVLAPGSQGHNAVARALAAGTTYEVEVNR